MKIKLFLIIAVLVTAILCSLGDAGYAQAQTVTNCMSYANTSDQISCLTNLLTQISAQITNIQAQQGAATTKTPAPATTPTSVPAGWCYTFNKNLGWADSGTNAVNQLHTALQDQGFSFVPDVGNVYNQGTSNAVIQLQTKYGIAPQSGYVGPETRAELNSLYGCVATSTTTPTLTTPTTTTTPTTPTTPAVTQVPVSNLTPTSTLTPASGAPASLVYTWLQAQPITKQYNSFSPNYWLAVASSSDGSHLIASIEGRTISSNGQYGGSIGGRLYISSDYGATWTEAQPAGNSDRYWLAVASSSDGSHLIVGVSPGRLYISSDYGATWKETQPAGDNDVGWYAAASSSDGSHLVADGAGFVFNSSDYGATWSKGLYPGLPNSVAIPANLSFGAGVGAGIPIASNSDGSRLIARGSGGIFLSSDYGATWKKANLVGDADAFKFSGVASSSDGSHLAINYNLFSGSGSLYISSDYGATWTLVKPPSSSDNWSSETFSPDGSRLIAYAGAHLYISSDLGATWTAIQQPSALQQLGVDEIKSVALSSNGSYIIEGGINGLYIGFTNNASTPISATLTVNLQGNIPSGAGAQIYYNNFVSAVSGTTSSISIFAKTTFEASATAPSGSGYTVNRSGTCKLSSPGAVAGQSYVCNVSYTPTSALTVPSIPSIPSTPAGTATLTINTPSSLGTSIWPYISLSKNGGPFGGWSPTNILNPGDTFTVKAPSITGYNVSISGTCSLASPGAVAGQNYVCTVNYASAQTNNPAIQTNTNPTVTTPTTTPLCTDSNWTSVLSPTTCPSSGTQTKTWTQTGTCSGGAAHPSSEQVSCTYQAPTTSTPAGTATLTINTPPSLGTSIWPYISLSYNGRVGGWSPTNILKPGDTFAVIAFQAKGYTVSTSGTCSLASPGAVAGQSYVCNVTYTPSTTSYVSQDEIASISAALQNIINQFNTLLGKGK